ncbi:unnamed protein product [Moneuplotes crassus]|uniref:Uncharacterized protein n=2 Tax=Euplotes crassus TaxID=5936 RepID=A0AAD1XCI2_EUPCR|nr:unnamed protein product [Moneuplotes crassus]
MIDSKLVTFLENRLYEEQLEHKPGEKYNINLNAKRSYMPKIGSKVYANRFAISKMMAMKKKTPNISHDHDLDDTSFLNEDTSPYSMNRRNKMFNRRINNNFLLKRNSKRSQIRGNEKMNKTGMDFMPYTNTSNPLSTTYNQDSNFRKYFSKPSSSASKRFRPVGPKKVNRTTFGNKLVANRSKRIRRASFQERMTVYKKNSMNYDEIKRIREEFNLERHEVYTLNSEFDSMLYMQENKSSMAENEGPSSKRTPIDFGLIQEQKGITCQFFFDNATFIKGILPEIKKRIITALGLDADSPHTTLNWEHYVTLYCMLEKSTYKDDGVKFWCTFFDPHGFGSVVESDYMTLLEKMVRGKSYDYSNHFTQLYAEKIQNIFEKNRCLGYENELVISRLEKCLKNGVNPRTAKNRDLPVIKEIWFSSALGNRELILDD